MNSTSISLVARSWWGRAGLFGLIMLLGGCQAAYLGALEKIGIPKREVLLDRVSKARSSQEDAKEQFASALEKFLAITKVEPGELKSRYEQLNGELKRNEARATEVRDRLASVKDVAEALFSEWKKELEQYSSADLRSRSEVHRWPTCRSSKDFLFVPWTSSSMQTR